MSSQRRKFGTEYKVEAAHRVIDSGRSVVEVACELGVYEMSLGNWVRDERRPYRSSQGNSFGAFERS